ncbi:MAG: hypothetical protein JO061_06175, partial [Acidobacteriaceae bacterium]|nr:hypothetical protein [Acidobacteriaceae bacterium]
MPTLTVGQIAAICGGDLQGDPALLISGANTVEQATASDLSFAENPKAFHAATRSQAGCLIVPPTFEQLNTRAMIHVHNPRAAFACALAALYPKSQEEAVIHPSAIVADTASLGKDCAIGAYVTIGAHARLGDQCNIAAGCRIGGNVVLGDDVKLH